MKAKSWLTEQKEKGGIKKIASYIPHGFQWLVFDKIGLYATSPGQGSVQCRYFLDFFWNSLFSYLICQDLVKQYLQLVILIICQYFFNPSIIVQLPFLQ